MKIQNDLYSSPRYTFQNNKMDISAKVQYDYDNIKNIIYIYEQLNKFIDIILRFNCHCYNCKFPDDGYLCETSSFIVVLMFSFV